MSNKDQDKDTTKNPFADIDLGEWNDINFGEWESFGFEDNPTKPTKTDTKKDPLDNYPTTDWDSISEQNQQKTTLKKG